MSAHLATHQFSPHFDKQPNSAIPIVPPPSIGQFTSPQTGTVYSPQTHRSIASPTMESGSKAPTSTDKPFSVSSLLSPPESKRADSFSSPLVGSASQSSTSTILPSIHELTMASSSGKPGLPPSPPISPANYNKENIDCSQEDGVRDPILFERGSGAGIPENVPLFTSGSHGTVEDAIISHHMANNDRVFPPSVAKPARHEYKLVLIGTSQVYKRFEKNPKAWMKRETESLEAIRAARRKAANPLAATQRRLAPAPSGVKKQRSAAPKIARVPRSAPKRTPPTIIHDSFDSPRMSATPPKAPRAPTTRDDSDYNSIPDFAPPLSTLPKGNNNILKTDWKGQMLDLTYDPDRHLLHEAEVKLASTLRLSAATYLTSKRRIFVGRIDALRIRKEFRKTDAQQACKIDVNKASKLWSAFEKVGWFKREHFDHLV